ncbi:photosystem II cytochrome c-550 [Vasconcelosia minhoensis]|nr:photosystem II cytochrome c-550 [Romeria gracilis]
MAMLISAAAWITPAMAVEIDPATLTVPLNDTGEQITLSTEQLAKGQRQFNSSCAQCHVDGGTKTNPDIDLGPRTLALATPPRVSVESIVDYLEHPTTYDGLQSLAELHPSTARAEYFPKMRDLTEDDLTAIAGYILVQPKIVGDQWSGGKPNR